MTDLVNYGTPYERKKTAAFNKWQAIKSSNDFAKTLQQTRGQRDLIDFGQRMQTGLEGFGSTFARRGLSRSGIFGRAQNQYSTNWANQKSSMLEAMQAKDNELKLSDANAYSEYNQTVADIEYQKMQDILATAAQLRGYRTIGGN